MLLLPNTNYYLNITLLYIRNVSFANATIHFDTFTMNIRLLFINIVCLLCLIEVPTKHDECAEEL